MNTENVVNIADDSGVPLLYTNDVIVLNGGKPAEYNHPKDINPNAIIKTGEYGLTRPKCKDNVISDMLTLPTAPNKNPIPNNSIGPPIDPKIIYFSAVASQFSELDANIIPVCANATISKNMYMLNISSVRSIALTDAVPINIKNNNGPETFLYLLKYVTTDKNTIIPNKNINSLCKFSNLYVIAGWKKARVEFIISVGSEKGVEFIINGA